MPNRLAQETSPYLLQHAQNPVDWYPWGAEALERAKKEDKPIFLSIGYSACHWCHVMEHESFENADIARAMNETFINIKVDREERPDLDHIYMTAVQLLTGRGGWPMSVFLTPELEPFFGGTYWPPTSRMGMPGFDRVLAAVGEAWRDRRAQAMAQARELREHIARAGQIDPHDAEFSTKFLQQAAASLERMYDHQYGGFGGAPKFPHALDLRLLLRYWRRDRREALLSIVTHTLDRMAAGGIYDHLGGGFHRYSVDERWLVPHFEKMLYDNALLLAAYVEAFQATARPEYARVARETADYLLREMTGADGPFYSTQDADSEGHEGKFYVWTPDQLEAVLGAELAAVFARVYDVTAEGNFEGTSILNLPKSVRQSAEMLSQDPAKLEVRLAEARKLLLEARGKRVWPGLDDKIQVNWNGLAIDALAQAGWVLGEPRYVEAAGRAAQFILEHLRSADGRLMHTWRAGRARFPAYLDDYAAFANSLVTLYEATFEEAWIESATELVDTMLAHFEDKENGGFFYTADDHEQLIARHKDVLDSSTPSGAALATTALMRLAKLTGRAQYAEAAERTFRSLARLMEQSPTAASQLLIALDLRLGPTPEIVILGDNASGPTAAAIQDLAQRYLPNRVLAGRSPRHTTPPVDALAGLLAGKTASPDQPTVFVCENFACQAPVHGAVEVGLLWDRLAPAAEKSKPAR